MSGVRSRRHTGSLWATPSGSRWATVDIAHAGARGVPLAPAHGSRGPTRRQDARSRGGPPSPYPPDHPKSLPGAGLIPPSQFAHASLERHLFTPPTRSERRTNDRGGHFYLTVRRTFSLNSDRVSGAHDLTCRLPKLRPAGKWLICRL